MALQDRLVAVIQAIGADVKALQASSETIPAGVMMEFAGAAAPAGYLLCNGTAVSRTTYAALYAALGGASSPYGAGDGSTTFNLPDHRDRQTLGVGTQTLGANDGLAAGATRVNTHTKNHSHSASTDSAGGQALSASSGSAGSHSHGGTAASAGDHSHSAGLLATNSPTAATTATTVQRNGITATGTAGAHTHTISTDTAAAHSHTVSVSSVSSHSHVVTVNASGEARDAYVIVTKIIKF